MQPAKSFKQVFYCPRQYCITTVLWQDDVQGGSGLHDWSKTLDVINHKVDRFVVIHRNNRGSSFFQVANLDDTLSDVNIQRMSHLLPCLQLRSLVRRWPIFWMCVVAHNHHVCHCDLPYLPQISQCRCLSGTLFGQGFHNKTQTRQSQKQHKDALAMHSQRHFGNNCQLVCCSCLLCWVDLHENLLGGHCDFWQDHEHAGCCLLCWWCHVQSLLGDWFCCWLEFFCNWFVVPVVVVVGIAVLGVIYGIFSRVWWSVLLPECSSWAGTLLVLEPISPFATLWHGQIISVIGMAMYFLTMYNELFFVTADGWTLACPLFVSIPFCLTRSWPARRRHQPRVVLTFQWDDGI